MKNTHKTSNNSGILEPIRGFSVISGRIRVSETDLEQNSPVE
jgi:hypothetical protein